MIYTTLSAYADIFNSRRDENATLEDVFNTLLALKQSGKINFNYEIIRRGNRWTISNAEISELKFFLLEYLRRYLTPEQLEDI